MTIAIITDTHCGARGSSSIFRAYMQYWYETEFFTGLKEKGVKTILHLGDFFDNRNSISVMDIDWVVNWFAPQLVAGGHEFIVILGNHDVAFKNTNKVHSLSVLKAAAPNNVTVIEEPTYKIIDGQQYALVPWINASNYDGTMTFLAELDDREHVIVAGHFEFEGFKHYANSAPADHGLATDAFKDFEEVWSGHYHHKSKIGNVRYMGSAFHLNWQDYGDARGFHLFNPGDLQFVENELCMFTQVGFDEATFKSMSDDEYKQMFEGRFVRLVIDREYTKVALMDTISKINRSKPHDLQILNTYALTEDAKDTNVEELEERTSKSTLQYIEDYTANESPEVKALMVELYNEAHTLMIKGE